MRSRSSLLATYAAGLTLALAAAGAQRGVAIETLTLHSYHSAIRVYDMARICSSVTRASVARWLLDPGYAASALSVTQKVSRSNAGSID